MRWGWCLLIFALASGLAGSLAREDDTPADGSVTVVDGSGKEVTIAGAKLTTGTRRLSWLGDPDGTTEDERKGPLALEFREVHSTTFAKGVITFVPISHVEGAKYDYDKQVVALSVKGRKEPLMGTLQYRGINVLGVSGSVDGKSTNYSCGVGKSAVKAVTFSGAKSLPDAKTTGTTWAIQIAQPTAKNPVLTVRNLKVFFQYKGGSDRLENAVPVRKGAVLTLNGTVKRVEILATDPNTNIAAAEVETTTGPERIIAIPLTQELEIGSGTLVGFIGEVDVGWKLFPLHTVRQITLTDVKKKVE